MVRYVYMQKLAIFCAISRDVRVGLDFFPYILSSNKFVTCHAFTGVWILLC